MHSTVKDSGTFLVVDPATRTVTAPEGQRALGVSGDHLSEQVTFEVPQFIDSHDVTMCLRKYITWANAVGEVGHDELTLDRTADGKAYFVWSVRDGLTMAPGFVKFSIHFEDADDAQRVVYRWGTKTCADFEVLDAINTTLGAYEAIYVAGNTLVIEDYTPVEDKTLALDMPGIIPEGTKVITEAGVHDVGTYAAVEVVGVFEAPTISVNGDTGVITATANGAETTHKLTKEDDADLLPANIRVGKRVFGVMGSLNLDMVDVNFLFHNQSEGAFQGVNFYYTCSNDYGIYFTNYATAPGAMGATIRVAVGSLITIVPTSGESVYCSNLSDGGSGGDIQLAGSTFASAPAVIGVGRSSMNVSLFRYKI